MAMYSPTPGPPPTSDGDFAIPLGAAEYGTGHVLITGRFAVFVQTGAGHVLPHLLQSIEKRVDLGKVRAVGSVDIDALFAQTGNAVAVVCRICLNCVDFDVLAAVINHVVDIAGAGCSGHAGRALGRDEFAALILVFGASIEIAADVFTAADFFVNGFALVIEANERFPTAGIAFVESELGGNFDLAAELADASFIKRSLAQMFVADTGSIDPGAPAGIDFGHFHAFDFTLGHSVINANGGVHTVLGLPNVVNDDFVGIVVDLDAAIAFTLTGNRNADFEVDKGIPFDVSEKMGYVNNGASLP